MCTLVHLPCVVIHLRRHYCTFCTLALLMSVLHLRFGKAMIGSTDLSGQLHEPCVACCELSCCLCIGLVFDGHRAAASTVLRLCAIPEILCVFLSGIWSSPSLSTLSMSRLLCWLVGTILCVL
jgi:hypothetical protein